MKVIKLFIQSQNPTAVSIVAKHLTIEVQEAAINVKCIQIYLVNLKHQIKSNIYKFLF